MKLLVTGASGFLGRHVVREALAAGHHVRALVRPASRTLPLGDQPGLEVARADLRSRDGIEDALSGIDAVIHLAADKAGDLYAQLAGTVVATENLLMAMAATGVDRLVLASSFSVYAYRSRRARAVIDEDAPLEPHPEERDAYCQTKLLQERLARTAAAEQGLRLTVLRPGVIYGPDNLWTARLGVQAGTGLWVRTGAWARIPLTYVEHCAEAFVLAAGRDAAVGRTYNVVDDNPPTQRSYLRLLAARAAPRPRVVPVNWTLMRLASWGIDAFNRAALGGRAKVPAILRPAALHARCKPMGYRNDRIRNELGWAPRYTLEEALDRSLGHAAEAQQGRAPRTPDDQPLAVTDACASPT